MLLSSGFTPEANLEAVAAAVEISSQRCSWGCRVSEEEQKEPALQCEGSSCQQNKCELSP